MPRKRHISPGFFTNPELYEAEALSGLPLRVAYAGLWCCADRAGRFEWKPKVLKLDVLPYDQVDFEAVLSALREHGFIRCYSVSGKLYGDIPTFSDHQHPHPKEFASSIPPYNDAGEHFADACRVLDSSMSQHPPYQPVGVSGPSEIQDLRMPEKEARAGAAPKDDTARNSLPDTYREDFDAMLRSSHSPDSFRREVAMLASGKHPTVEGATPDDVGRAIRELALEGGRPNRLATFTHQLVKRRREKTRDERARVETVANERRKREERTMTVSGGLTPLSETLSKLGIVPDKGAA